MWTACICYLHSVMVCKCVRFVEFEWNFMSTHNWNEMCTGDWVLTLRDEGPESNRHSNHCKLHSL